MEQAHHSILQAIVRHLEQGARDRRSPLHTPVVGTADGDLRIMVLRDFSAGEWTMRFHTDARSPKVRTLGEGGRVTVLGYDPSAKLQLRLYGSGRTEHTGPLVDAAWQASSEYARRCYLAEASPGSPMPAAGSGLPAWAEGIRPDEAQLVPARDNFAIVLVHIEAIDWLHLAHDGHRRARFTVGADGTTTAEWLAP